LQEDHPIMSFTVNRVDSTRIKKGYEK